MLAARESVDELEAPDLRRALGVRGPESPRDERERSNGKRQAERGRKPSRVMFVRVDGLNDLGEARRSWNWDAPFGYAVR